MKNLFCIYQTSQAMEFRLNMDDECCDDVLPFVTDTSGFEYHEWLPGIYKDIREYSCKSDPKQAIFTALESFLVQFRRYMRTSTKEKPGRKYDYHLVKHSTMIMYILYDLVEAQDHQKFYLKLTEVLGNCMVLWMRYFSSPEGLFTTKHCQCICRTYVVFINIYSEEFLFLKIFAYALFINHHLPSTFYDTIKRHLEGRVGKPRRNVEVKADQLYILYILAFKQLEIHRPPEEDPEFLDIPTYANKFMKPRLSLLSNHRYAPYLPALTAADVESGRATHIILKKLQKQFLIKLSEAAVKEDWLKGSDDNTIITVDLSGDDEQAQQPEPEKPKLSTSQYEESHSSKLSELSCDWPAKLLLLEYMEELAHEKSSNALYRLVDTIDLAETENETDENQCVQQSSINQNIEETQNNDKIPDIDAQTISKISKTLVSTPIRNESPHDLDINQNLPNLEVDLTTSESSEPITDSSALILLKDSDAVNSVLKNKAENGPPSELGKILSDSLNSVTNTSEEEVLIDSIDLDDPLEKYEEGKCFGQTKDSSPKHHYILEESNTLQTTDTQINQISTTNSDEDMDEVQNQEEARHLSVDTTILPPLENVATDLHGNHIQPEQPSSEVEASGVIYVPSNDESNDVNNEVYELQGNQVFIEECNEEIIGVDAEHQTNEDETTKCLEEVEVEIVQDTSMLQMENNEGILICDVHSVCAEENLTESCNNSVTKEHELQIINDVQTEVEIETNNSDEFDYDEQTADIVQIGLSNAVNEDSTSNLNILSEVCSARVEENCKMAIQEASSNENLFFDNIAQSQMCSKSDTLDIKQTKDDNHNVEESEVFVNSTDKLDTINEQEYNSSDDDEPRNIIGIEDTKPKSPVNAVNNDFSSAAYLSQQEITEINFTEHANNLRGDYEEPPSFIDYYIDDNNTKGMENKNNSFDERGIHSCTEVSSRHENSSGTEALLSDARNLEGRVSHLRSPDEDSHISTSSIVDESETYDNIDPKTDDVHIEKISAIDTPVASANKFSSDAPVLFSISTGKKLSPPKEYIDKFPEESTQSRRVVFSTSSSTSSTQKRHGSIDSNIPSMIQSGIVNPPVFTTDKKSYPMIAKIEPDDYNFPTIEFEDVQTNLISKRRNQIVRKRKIIAQADENIHKTSSAKRKAVLFAPIKENPRIDIYRNLKCNSTIIERKSYENSNTIQNTHAWKSSINFEPTVFNQQEDSPHEDSELVMSSTETGDGMYSCYTHVKKKTVKKVNFNLDLNKSYDPEPFSAERVKLILSKRGSFTKLKPCIRRTSPESYKKYENVKNRIEHKVVKELNISQIKRNLETLDQMSCRPFKCKIISDLDRYLLDQNISIDNDKTISNKLKVSQERVEQNCRDNIKQTIKRIDPKIFHSVVRVRKGERIIKDMLIQNKRKKKFEQLSRKQQDNEILKHYSDEKLHIMPSVVLRKYDPNYQVNSRLGTSCTSVQAQNEDEENIKKEKLYPCNRQKIRVKMYTKHCKNLALQSLSREIKRTSLSAYNVIDLSKSINVNSTHIHGYLYRSCLRPIRTDESNTNFILQVFHGDSNVCMKPCIILLEQLRRVKELLHQNNLKYSISRCNQYQHYPKMIFKSETIEESEQSCITEFEDYRNRLNNSRNERRLMRCSPLSSCASYEEENYAHRNQKSRCYGSKVKRKNCSESVLNKCSLKTEIIHHNTNLSQSQLCEAKQNRTQEDTSTDIATMQYSYTLQNIDNNAEVHTSKLSFILTDEIMEYFDELKKSYSPFDEPLTSCDTHVPVASNDCAQINNLHDTTDISQESPLVLLAEGSNTSLPGDELPADNKSENNDSPIELFDRTYLPCDDDHESDFESREHSFIIKPTKTYSTTNIIRNVFVPPELEMNFEDLKESSEKRKNEEVHGKRTKSKNLVTERLTRRSNRTDMLINYRSDEESGSARPNRRTRRPPRSWIGWEAPHNSFA